jgi:hypothetical protein
LQHVERAVPNVCDDRAFGGEGLCQSWELGDDECEQDPGPVCVRKIVADVVELDVADEPQDRDRGEDEQPDLDTPST